ncbi:tRNA (5-methylaminomethyl-2-thiouridine)(34)-methyltransferase MnmD [Qingshengfaniella alkalisoli]|uniref:tRNA (5-methylaminomethyl-2-thiouridine)(34)-methyltransferase MnmD n=1 Tax=Qingshengfaniella alkalisoli TaxID=2599296 RepID=A0A5B8I7R1_9RHOB|nr:tRNA (5-methylaminomethyl-2-thiouridine)(34)-methyltransferase MnmD [Qingshengfaniella alkalisoli]QDY69895.1 tRNA (5-methylaminomethyl-2-thiouridine)(34)-methyltransferase MnmD [Qingshengfaniella alkalisoli]
MMSQPAEIEWKDGRVPVSTRFDDPYFSITNGLEETRHVFLDGNRLPQRFKPGFHIAELGFGTGLNLLAAWQLWQQAGIGGKLHFTSFEAFPMQSKEMQKSLAVFPDLSELAGPLMDAWRKGATEIDAPDLHARIIIGDARQTVPAWSGRADAWFLDGFSPAKNPELWDPVLMNQIAVHTAEGGSFATYTAAGHVRRSLRDAGFIVSRIAGFGRKRHMSVGVLS